MKCPFCQQELKDQWVGQYVAHEYFNCPKCKMNGNAKLWQELIRTQEELHKANAELDYIKELVEKSNAFIYARIKVAAEQIARDIIAQVKIIKEQKDV